MMLWLAYLHSRGRHKKRPAVDRSSWFRLRRRCRRRTPPLPTSKRPLLPHGATLFLRPLLLPLPPQLPSLRTPLKIIIGARECRSRKQRRPLSAYQTQTVSRPPRSHGASTTEGAGVRKEGAVPPFPICRQRALPAPATTKTGTLSAKAAKRMPTSREHEEWGRRCAMMRWTPRTLMFNRAVLCLMSIRSVHFTPARQMVSSLSHSSLREQRFCFFWKKKKIYEQQHETKHTNNTAIKYARCQRLFVSLLPYALPLDQFVFIRHTRGQTQTTVAMPVLSFAHTKKKTEFFRGRITPHNLYNSV